MVLTLKKKIDILLVLREMNFSELAKKLGLSKEGLYRIIRKNTIPRDKAVIKKLEELSKVECPKYLISKEDFFIDA